MQAQQRLLEALELHQTFPAHAPLILVEAEAAQRRLLLPQEALAVGVVVGSQAEMEPQGLSTLAVAVAVVAVQ